VARPKHKTTLSSWLKYTAAITYTVALCMGAMTVMVIVLLVVTLFGTSPKEIEESYNRQQQAVQVFTGKDKAYDSHARQELAKSLLDVSRQGASVDMLEDRKVVAQVEHIAATGDSIDLNPKPFRFWKHNQVTLIILGSIAYVIFVVEILFLHVAYCNAYRIRFHDLPWRAVWPWILVVASPLLLWPIGLELWYSHQAARRKKEQSKAAAEPSV
jgi:hypothetical protein